MGSSFFWVLLLSQTIVQREMFGFVQEAVEGRCMSLLQNCLKCLSCSTDMQAVLTQRQMLALNQSPDASPGHLVHLFRPLESTSEAI